MSKSSTLLLSMLMVLAVSPVLMADVTFDDGSHRREVRLDVPEKALEVPPAIWALQRYIGHGSTLMVLCDLPYDESDYIPNYDEFLASRKGRSV